MRIIYDEAKRRSNMAKHGLDFASLTPDFFLSCYVEPAKDGRSLAIGRTDDGAVVIAVVHRPLGSEAISIISMRRASKQERNRIDG